MARTRLSKDERRTRRREATQKRREVAKADAETRRQFFWGHLLQKRRRKV